MSKVSYKKNPVYTTYISHSWTDFDGTKIEHISCSSLDPFDALILAGRNKSITGYKYPDYKIKFLYSHQL